MALLLNNGTEHRLVCIRNAKSLCYWAASSLLLPLAILVAAPALVVVQALATDESFFSMYLNILPGDATA